MTESESVALPLGDAPLTKRIISQTKIFVNTFLKIFFLLLFFVRKKANINILIAVTGFFCLHKCLTLPCEGIIRTNGNILYGGEHNWT